MRSDLATPPTVRAEGLTELVGDVVLECTGGTPTPAGVDVPKVDIQLFLNTNLTSRLLGSSLSDALLLIDDPASDAQRPCVGATCGVVGTGAGVSYNQPGTTGPANVYLSTPGASGAVIWLGAPVDPPASFGVRALRLTNLRANAALTTGTTIRLSQIKMFISGPGGAEIPVTNSQPTLAFVQTGLTDAVRRTGNPDDVVVSLQQCVSHNPSLPAGTPFPTGKLRYTEGFASAFKRRSPDLPANPNQVPIQLDQNVPGQIDAGTETGFRNFDRFVTFVGPLTGQMAIAGSADHGTRVRALFNNVPASVNLYVATAVSLHSSTGLTSGFARLIGTQASGAGPFVQIPANANGSAPVALAGGSGQAVYEVLRSDPTTQETIEIPYFAQYITNPSVNLPALGLGSADGALVPLSTVNTASTSAPIPRFTGMPIPRDALEIEPCPAGQPLVTNILSKGGTREFRDWSLQVANPNHTSVTEAEMTNMTLTQTAGPQCSPAPTVLTSFPTLFGTLARGAVFNIPVSINFAGCEPHTRFTATFDLKYKSPVELEIRDRLENLSH